MKEKLLFSGTDDILIGQVCAVLKDNGIAYIKNEENPGEYMSVTLGTSSLEKEILVNEEDFERAKELIELIISNKDDIQFTAIPDELKNPKEDDKIYNKYVIIRRLLGLTIFALPLIIIICLIISSII